MYNPIPWAFFRQQRYAGARPLRGLPRPRGLRSRPGPGRALGCSASLLTAAERSLGGPAAAPAMRPFLTTIAQPAPAGDLADRGREVQIYHFKR